MLSHAKVALLTTSNVIVQTTAIDFSGNFRFETYDGVGMTGIRFEGFRLTTTRVAVASRAPSPCASRCLWRTSNRKSRSAMGARRLARAPPRTRMPSGRSESARELAGLRSGVIATVSRFLDAGSLGSGGVTVVVNGMEVSALGVNASAVPQISINPRPRSGQTWAASFES